MKFLWTTIAAAGLGACLQATPPPAPADSAFVLFDAKGMALLSADGRARRHAS